MKLPQSEKVWIAGGLASAVVLSAAAWFGAISPENSNASELKSQRADAETQNTVLLVKTNKLRTDSKNLGELSAQLAKRLQQLPVEANFDDLTVQLYQQAAASHVSLSSIVIGAVTPATGAAAGGASAGAPTASAGSIFTVPITVVSSGSLAAQKVFLTQVQEAGPRVALVTSAKLVPGDNQGAASIEGGSNMSTEFNVFVAPQSPAVAAQLAKQAAAGSSG
jgi:hypothetical protein